MPRREQAVTIINSYTGLATASAVIPVPVADVVAITGLQVTMIIHLGNAYGKTISRHTARSFVLAALAGSAGMFLFSLIKTIPGVGSIIGGVSQMAIAGTITYSLGLAVKYMLDHDKDLNKDEFGDAISKLDPEELKKKKEELKQKLIKTKAAQKAIRFRAEPEKFTDNMIFRFNLSQYSDATLRIRNLGLDPIFESQIEKSRTKFTYDPQNLITGKYFAYLECEDLIPIQLEIEKV